MGTTMKSSATLAILIVLLAMAVAGAIGAVQGDCPLPSKMTSCSPKCTQDSDCAATGGRCCPNLCNYKSCVIAKAGSNSDKYGQGGGTGTYCGNTKCRAGEKCVFDQATKRNKCVRA